jgi:hypothetical protein
MGRGATATMERLAASLGQLAEAIPRFGCALDIPKGGVYSATIWLRSARQSEWRVGVAAR